MKTQWTALPNTGGVFWRRVTLSDGTIYSTLIQNVVSVWGRLYFADENWGFTTHITEQDMVTWSGPLTPPPP